MLIPERLDEITPEWLTAALRSRGFLQDAKIRSIDQQILGEGEGFMGVISRLSLSFDGDPSGAFLLIDSFELKFIGKERNDRVKV